MKVECQDIEQFIECLRHENKLFRNAIRMNISRNGMDGGKDEVRFEVIIQVSALVRVLEIDNEIQEESQYLLEVAQCCGIDYMDSSNDPQGSEVAKKLKCDIELYAKERDWKVLPGIIGF